MPQDSRGYGAPGPPRRANLELPVDAGDAAKSLHFAHRAREREVVARPDVRSSERHEQVDIRAPRTDPSQLHERGVRSVGVERAQAVDVELPPDDRTSQRVDVRGLLPREPGGRKRALAELEEPLRCWAFCDGDEALIRRTRRRERHLLLEDDLYERCEGRRALPKWRRAEPEHGALEVPVPADEHPHAARELRLGETCGHPSSAMMPGPLYGWRRPAGATTSWRPRRLFTRATPPLIRSVPQIVRASMGSPNLPAPSTIPTTG